MKRVRNIVLLLLLTALFGARTLVAQYVPSTGFQFFTVYGTQGGSGRLTLEFNDASNNGYYATYDYGPNDTPKTAATYLYNSLN